MRRVIPPGFIRGMSLRCLLALSLLAGMAIAGFLVTRDKSRLFRGYETLISVAGRQRLLSVKAALISRKVRDSHDPGDRRQLLGELGRLANELEKNHSLILLGDDATGVSPAPPEVRRVFLEPPHRLDDAMRKSAP